MPSDHSAGLDDLKSLAPVDPVPAKPDPEQAIYGVKSGPLSGSLERAQLLAESQVLKNQASAVWKTLP